MDKAKEDAQTDYLKSCLRQSLFMILEEKPFEKISVSEIVKGAGVSRMSFYRYYETKEDIIRQYINDSFQDFMHNIENDKKELLESTTLFFKYFRGHKKQTELLIERGLFYLFSESFANYLADFNEAIDKNPDISKRCATYYYPYIAGGLLSIISQWIQSGMKESDKQMAIILKEIKEAQGKRYLQK